ncbi:Alpha/Beta hydrolase protein [Polychytrium aggregatum]|uniref:Alpha/Beta hydrolase protein n=1 Tax=Polychytrium aggregatum TaxID=110093 RepID=UPI0022FE08CB|nr:Alpha/Beta hydrolase protein [Polychytrium aggregatum]KAI9204142.1 Alpha/Beta hydrolase protein [Polychytrium aggregatum]
MAGLCSLLLSLVSLIAVRGAIGMHLHIRADNSVPQSIVNTISSYTPFAAMTYCSNTSIAEWKSALPNPVRVSDTQQWYIEETGSRGYVTYDMDHNQVVVAFRGTTEIKSWVLDSEFVPESIGQDTSGNVVKVHDGFLVTYRSSQAIMISQITDVLCKHPGASLVIVGHSLGAALATFVILDGFGDPSKVSASQFLKSRIDPSHVTVYTFGSPRVGNLAFRNLVESFGVRFYRSVNYNDVVPHLPPESLQYVHVRTEYWINANFELVTCNDITNGEDTDCANSLNISALLLQGDWSIPHDHFFNFDITSGFCV